MPILCFGGSFNPIHNGHLRCADAVATRAGYDRVLLIPSAQPPHKPDTTELAPASVFEALAQNEAKRKIRELSKRVPCGGSGQQTGTCL